MSEQRDETAADSPTFDDPTDLRFVGTATAEVLAQSDVSAADIAHKRATYRDLVDAGVNPGVAARIRREHSLAWSTTADGDDLERRSAQIRGLGDAERAWVAASSSDWAESDADSPENASANESGGASQRTRDDRPTLTSSDWSPTGDAEAQTGAETDGSGDFTQAEQAWRDRSEPTPVTEVEGIDDDAADALADAGVTSVRSLATADPEHVADALGLDEARVRDWHDAAKRLIE